MGRRRSTASVEGGSRSSTRRHFTFSGARVLNVRVAVRSVIALLALIVSVYYWHEYQVTRQSRLFLAAAEDAREEQRWDEVILQLENFLYLHPNNADQMAQLAKAFEHSRIYPDRELRAMNIYARAAEIDPTRFDDRARVAELQLRINPQAAVETAEGILADRPEFAPALYARAQGLDRLAALAGGNIPLENVVAAFEDVLKADSSNYQAALRLGILLRRHAADLTDSLDLSEEQIRARGDRIIDELVTRNPRSPDVHVARHAYRRVMIEAGLRRAPDQPDLLDDDLRRALAIDPGHLDARLSAADALVPLRLRDPIVGRTTSAPRQKRLMESAEDHIQAVLLSHSNDARPYLAMAQIHLMRNNVEAALRMVTDALKKVSANHPILRLRMSEFLLILQRWDDASRSLDETEQVLARLKSTFLNAEDVVELIAAGKILRASWYLSAGNEQWNPGRASALLREAAKLSQTTRISLTTQAELGRCYAQLSQWDLAVSAYDKAVMSAPAALAPRLGLAASLRRAGRFQEAAKQYRDILERLNKAPESLDVGFIWFELGRCELADVLRAPTEKRNWKEFDAVVTEARRRAPLSYRILFLDLSAMLSKRGSEARPEVLRRLREATVKFPRQLEPWALTFELYVQLGQASGAEDALARMEAIEQHPLPEHRLRLNVLRGGKPRRGPGEVPVEGSAEGSEDESSVLDPSVTASLPARRPARGRDELNRLLESAEKAVQSRDVARMKNEEAALRKVEGEEGTFTDYFQVRRLLVEARDGRPAALDEAERTCDQLLARRSTWHLAHAALAMIAESKGDVERSVRSYERAFHYGDRRPVLARKMVGQWMLLGRNEEARRALERFPDEWRVAPELLGLGTTLSLSMGQIDAAERVARLAIRGRPKDPEAHAALGRILATRATPESLAAAEASFQTAVEVAPSDARAWISLLFFHVAHRQPDRSMRVFSTLRGLMTLYGISGESLTQSQQAMIVGRCLEMSGNVIESEKHYRLAIDLAKDEKELPGLAWWTLIVNRVRAGVPSWGIELDRLPPAIRWCAGVSLWADAAAAGGAVARGALRDDPTLQAIALLAHGDPSTRHDALARLERSSPALERGDHALLARFFAWDGRKKEAMAHLERWISAPPLPSQRTEIVQLLLWLDEPAVARRVISGFDRRWVNSSPGAATLTQLAFVDQRREEALRVTREFVFGPSQTEIGAIDRLARARQAGDWLRAHGESSAGTQLIRDASRGVPDGQWAVAGWLAFEPESVDEAIELCEQMLGRKNDAIAAKIFRQLLTRGYATESQIRRVSGLLAGLALTMPKDDPDLVAAQMACREAEQKPQEAVKLGNDFIARSPTNVLILSELARLASRDGKHDDALKLVDRAMRVAGPHLGLLDLKGRLYLAAHRPADAVRLWEVATLDSNPPAPLVIHLANGYQVLGLPAQSRRALRIAGLIGIGDLSKSDFELLGSLGR